MILMNYFDFTNHNIPHYKLLAFSSLIISSTEYYEPVNIGIVGWIPEHITSIVDVVVE